MKLLAVCFFILAVSSILACGDGDSVTEPDPVVLDSNYSGFLTLTFSNTFPEFSETISVSVKVDRYGSMTFGTGALSYSGEDNNGQIKINRTGTLNIQPAGGYVTDTQTAHFAVNENTTVTEHMQTWVWDGSQWQPSMDENITATWNSGLVFYLDEAVIESGSVCGIVNAQGSVVWVLTLTPDLVP